MPQAYFTFAKQIFHIEDISLVAHGTNIIEKDQVVRLGLFWWTRRGSNSRPYGCEPYALPAELRARFAFARGIIHHAKEKCKPKL